MAKKDRAGVGALPWLTPFRGGGQKQQKMGRAVRRLAKPETIAANPDEHWLWSTYPQKLWITLFMKLGDQAVARANTGLQGLFKKYRQ
ncbi:hypothetical protein ACB268_16865 [Aeromonas sanarellii]